MNLHALVSGMIGAVNPAQPVTVRVSTGYTTAPDGSRTSGYAAPFTATAQLQDLSSRDLHQLDALNIQGSQRAIYLNGSLDGILRVNQKGGDLITTSDGSIWLTTQVLEQWPDWAKVAVTLQDGA